MLPRTEHQAQEKFSLLQSKPVTAADKIFTQFAYTTTARIAAILSRDKHGYKDFGCTNKHWKKGMINLTVTIKY